MPYGSIAADKITNSDGFTLGGGGASMKNRIINGNMVINQRAFSGTPTNGAYTLDRFNTLMPASSKFTVSQSSTAPAGFINSLLVTSSSAYTVGASEAFGIQQVIEGFNITDLAWGTANAKTVTLSFQVYSSLTGTFGGALQNYGADRSYPFSYTISSANTWTSISITIPGDQTGTWLTTNSGGIALIFSMGTGSTKSGTAGSWGSTYYASVTGATSVVGTSGATFYITGVQLEVGSTATSFDYRPYGTELALCRRYYFKSDMGSGGVKLGSVYNAALNRAFIQYDFQVSMRTTPTLTYTIGSGTANDEYKSTDYAQIYLNITASSTNITAFNASAEL